MVNYQLLDNHFSHEEYTVPQKQAENVRWIRENLNPVAPTFFSHFHMLADGRQTFTNKYGLIFESQSILPAIYQYARVVAKEYNLIFTHSSALLNDLPNARWIPGGGIWVGGKVNETLLGGSGGEIAIYPKTKFCSIVSSNKSYCPLHQYRTELVKFCESLDYEVDVFGTVNGGSWTPIIDSLQDYMFSIVVENFVDEQYFTEKLLNCFATGTIPIYLGARNLNMFDNDGIIRIDSPTDFLEVMDSLSEELYYSKMDAIKNNFRAVPKYNMIEDYIFNHYHHEINGY